VKESRPEARDLRAGCCSSRGSSPLSLKATLAGRLRLRGVRGYTMPVATTVTIAIYVWVCELLELSGGFDLLVLCCSLYDFFVVCMIAYSQF
jgi:hypothetical protein